MNLEKKIVLSLNEIHKKLKEDGDIKKALKSTKNLGKVIARLGKNKETLSCSYLHSKETLKEAYKENRIILSSDLMLHEIILRKS